MTLASVLAVVGLLLVLLWGLMQVLAQRARTRAAARPVSLRMPHEDPAPRRRRDYP